MSMPSKKHTGEPPSPGAKLLAISTVPPDSSEQRPGFPAVLTRVEFLPAVDWRVKKIVLFIDSEDGKVGPDMTDICRKLDLGISADYAAKLFKKETGVGFREYAARKRLIKGATQLAETSLSIKIIAADLGYNSPQDFSRRFKFQYRVKPGEFRRQQHN